MASNTYTGANYGFQVGCNQGFIRASFYSYTTEDIDRSCLRDLRCPDSLFVKNRLKETKDKLVPQSFKWILQDPRFRSWRYENDVCLLWIKGGAGKGKTMMSIGLIEELSKVQHESNVVTYFFCQNADDELNTLESIIKGLILNLVNQRTELKESLRRRWNTKNDCFDGDVTSWRNLWDILFEMLFLCNSSKVFIVVDAFDECQDTGLIDFLRLLVRNGLDQPAKIKWLLTSRQLDSAERGLLVGNDQLQISLELNSRNVSEAVDAYISYKVDELSHLHRYDEKLRRKLKAELNARANGTFLWVSLVCKKLETVSHNEALATIESLPPGLHPLYDRILNQIGQGDLDDVRKSMRLLQVMILVYRPLRVEEVPSVTGLTHEGNAIMALVNRCASLIKMQENRIEFIHQSARDYLAGASGQSLLDSYGHFGHYEIVLGCLSHLSNRLRINLVDLPRPGSSKTSWKTMGDRERNARLACLEYAATFWVQHLNEVNRRMVVNSWTAVKGEVCSFLRMKLLEWLECISLLNELQRATEGLKILVHIMKDDPPLLALLHDSAGFLLQHYDTLTYWPLQIYSSAIVFSPEFNMVKRINLSKIPVYLRKVPLMEDNWTSQGQTVARHSNYVTTVAFSSDGKQIASGSNDKTIKLWDAVTGESLKTLTGHYDYVTTVAFSPDGKQIASGSDDQTIKLWDTATGDLQKTLEGHSDWVRTLAFSPDGKQIASGSSDTAIKLWNTATGDFQKTLEGHSNYITTVLFSPDGSQIASGSRDNTIKLWNTENGDLQRTLEGHTSGVITVAFSPDGKQLASVSYDKEIRLWDMVKPLKSSRLFRNHFGIRFNLRPWKEIKTSKQVYSVRFSQNSRCLATDMGPIMLDGVTAEEKHDISNSLSDIFVRNQWISYGDVPFFRLPSDSRSVCYAVQEDQVAIGLESGRVLRFDIDRSSLQSMLE